MLIDLRYLFEDDYHFTFMDLIKEARAEGLKKENWKTEWIRGHISLFVRDSRGLLTQFGRV